MTVPVIAIDGPSASGKGTVAARVAAAWRETQADAICVDGGAGSGVVDALRHMRVPNVYEIHFGGAADNIPSTENATPLYFYEQGSWGPEEANWLVDEVGGWHNPPPKRDG